VDEVTSKAIEIALIDLERVENSTTGETRKRVVWVIDGLRALFRQPTQPVVDVNQQLFLAAKELHDYKPAACFACCYSDEELQLWENLGKALLSAGKEDV
jgi:hypothetical protein